jgi:membrane protease YdiL (CAAX protease family)
VQLRLSKPLASFAILLGALLYAFYHIGYGMPLSEISFLFLIGVLYAVIFRLTKNVFILWPLLQPMGQLVTLVRDGLSLPVLAALGFIEVLGVMVLLVWLAQRYKHTPAPVSRLVPIGATACQPARPQVRQDAHPVRPSDR